MKRIDTPEPERKPFCAIDIETAGLTGAFIYAGWKAEDSDTYHTTDSLDSLVNYILDNPQYCYYAHNGGFDYRYLVPYLRCHPRVAKLSYTVQNRSRIIRVKVHSRHAKRVIELRDSMAVFQCSLEKLTQTFCPELVKLVGAIDFEHETFDVHNSLHLDYLRRDVLGLLTAMVRADETMYRAFGVHLRVSAAATAMAAYRRTIEPNTTYYSPRKEVDEFVRRAYYGGRVYYKDTLKHINVSTIDMNAMYATAMREGVPVGSGIATAREVHGKPGFYRCTINTPRQGIPCVPLRDTGKLCWPTGTFDSYVDLSTIQYARQQGIHVAVHEGYYFDSIAYPFRQFIDTCERLELEHPDSALASVAKLMRNSLYGKFGSRADHAEYQSSIADPGGEWTPVIDPLEAELREIDGLWTRETSSHYDYMHPEWAAWITATARRLLYINVHRLGADNVIYIDTDSITVPSFIIADSGVVIGAGYGKWKVETNYEWFQALGPKQYHGRTTDGRWKVRNKGVPTRLISETAVTAAALGEAQRYKWQSPTTFLTYLKTGEYGAERTRTVRKQS